MKTREKTGFPGVSKSPGTHTINRYIRINRYCNRPLAFLLVKALYQSPISPNQVSVLSFVTALAAAFLFISGNPGGFLAGGILAQISSILDCADGQLARARKEFSHYGAHLDLVFDRIGDFLILTAISYGHYLYSGQISLLIMGLLSAGLYLLQVNLYYLTNSYRKNDRTGETAEARGLLLFSVLLFALLNRLDILIIALLIETAGACLYRLGYFLYLGVRGGRRT